MHAFFVRKMSDPNYDWQKGQIGGNAMSESTINAKGQTTVPAAVRALTQTKAGTRLVWTVLEDGTIIVRFKSRSVFEMAGMLKAPKGRAVKIEDMNPPD
jgi:antitoxin PrlF